MIRRQINRLNRLARGLRKSYKNLKEGIEILEVTGVSSSGGAQSTFSMETLHHTGSVATGAVNGFASSGGFNAENQLLNLATPGLAWDGTAINFTSNSIRQCVWRVPQTGTLEIDGTITHNLSDGDFQVHIFTFNAGEVEGLTSSLNNRNSAASTTVSSLSNLRHAYSLSLAVTEGQYFTLAFYNNTTGSVTYYAQLSIKITP